MGAVTKVEVESVAPTDNSSPPLRQTSPQLARITAKPVLSEAEELKLREYRSVHVERERTEYHILLTILLSILWSTLI